MTNINKYLLVHIEHPTYKEASPESKMNYQSATLKSKLSNRRLRLSGTDVGLKVSKIKLEGSPKVERFPRVEMSGSHIEDFSDYTLKLNESSSKLLSPKSHTQHNIFLQQIKSHRQQAKSKSSLDHRSTNFGRKVSNSLKNQDILTAHKEILESVFPELKSHNLSKEEINKAQRLDGKRHRKYLSTGVAFDSTKLQVEISRSNFDSNILGNELSFTQNVLDLNIRHKSESLIQSPNGVTTPNISKFSTRSLVQPRSPIQNFTPSFCTQFSPRISYPIIDAQVSQESLLIPRLDPKNNTITKFSDLNSPELDSKELRLNLSSFYSTTAPYCVHTNPRGIVSPINPLRKIIFQKDIKGVKGFMSYKLTGRVNY